MSDRRITPDYGSHARQHDEYMELCGLLDPAERYDAPQGPAIRFVKPITRYPLDRR